MKRKILAAVSAILMLFSLQATAVYAEETEETTEHDVIYYQYGDGIPVRQGGVNSIDGVKAESKEETEQLEASIRSQDYILVTTDDKEITDEEFEQFALGYYYPPYYKYFDRNNEYYWTKYKVYVYKPCYEAAMEQLEEKQCVEALTDGELATSTVVIDYSCWYEKERAGKILDEYNDNIPEWYTETGYLQISTSMEVDVTLELVYEHTRYKFRVSPQEPFLVRLKAGEYNVRVLNTTDVSEAEEAVPYDNTIQVQTINTKDKPLELDLSNTVQTLGVQPLAPDEPFDDGIDDSAEEETTGYSLTEERVEVQEQETPEKEEQSHRIWTIIFISVGGIAVLVIIILIVITKKKYSNE